MSLEHLLQRTEHLFLYTQQIFGNGIVKCTISSSITTLFSKSLLYTLDVQSAAANIWMENIRTLFNATDRNKSHRVLDSFMMIVLKSHKSLDTVNANSFE